jgi:hypothetical protein
LDNPYLISEEHVKEDLTLLGPTAGLLALKFSASLDYKL